MAPFLGDILEQIACSLRAGRTLRRLADHEGVAHIALVPIENQAEVNEIAVVFTQAHVRQGALAIGFGGVRANADDHRVPQPLHAELLEHLHGLRTRLVLADAGPHARANALHGLPAPFAGALHQRGIEPGADGFAVVRFHDQLASTRAMPMAAGRPWIHSTLRVAVSPP
jgi:hypothetical protein